MSTSINLAIVLVAFALVIQSAESKSSSRQVGSDINDGMVTQNLDELSSDESISWSKMSSEEEDGLPLLQTAATKHPKPTKSARQEQGSQVASAPVTPPTSATQPISEAAAAATASSAGINATIALGTSKPEPVASVPPSTATATPSAVTPAQQASTSSTEKTTTTAKPGHGHQGHMNFPTLFKRKNDTVVTIRFVPLRELLSEKIARFRNLFRKPAAPTTKPESGSGTKHFHFFG